MYGYGQKHLFEMARMQLYNHQLTNYLALLSDESLYTIMHLIVSDDIGDDECLIYDAIRNEFAYRESNKQLRLRKIK